MARFVFAAIAVGCVLAGCASAPTREDVDAFKLLNSGHVAPGNASLFADCLTDGFDRAHWAMTNIQTRQTKRTGLARIESRANQIVLISADVHDNGRVELYESSISVLNTSGEVQTFADCLRTYAVK